MAARVLLQRRSAAPLAATLVGGAMLAYPRTARAEAPAEFHSKKPIYDDVDATPNSATLVNTTPVSTSAPSSPSQPTAARPARPTPTDRLAGQVRRARLFLYRQTSRAEDALNAGMDRAFALEQSFTGTVASLAPPPASGERLMPGAIYVLVAALAGSIASRGRNIVLRAAFPLAFGAVAARVVLPVTSERVGDLAWRYEKRFPAVADAHLRAREAIVRNWETAKAHTAMTVARVDEKVGDARGAVEGWVKKGK